MGIQTNHQPTPEWAAIGQKECCKCHVTKPLSDFYIRGKGKKKGTPEGRCRKCMAEYRRNNYETTRCVEIQRRYKLKSLYGITPEDYDRMLEDQGGVCAICESDDPKEPKGGFFSVDHCHDTGKVRGLLCTACNRAMGMLKDSPALLRAAADYLERSA